MALVLPILVLLVAGIMQLGILLAGQNALVNGIREAARFGSVLQTTSIGDANLNAGEVHARLRDVLEAGLPGYSADNLTAVTVCYASYENPGPGDTAYSVRLMIDAEYRHPLFVPIVAQILDGLDGSADSGLTLSASETFRVENLPLSSTDLPDIEPGHCPP